MAHPRSLLALAVAAVCATPVMAQSTGAPAASSGSSAPGMSASPFETLDRNSDGYITREEARGNADLEDRFPQIDRDRDGRISRSEMTGGSAVGAGQASPSPANPAPGTAPGRMDPVGPSDATEGGSGSGSGSSGGSGNGGSGAGGGSSGGAGGGSGGGAGSGGGGGG